VIRYRISVPTASIVRASLEDGVAAAHLPVSEVGDGVASAVAAEKLGICGAPAQGGATLLGPPTPDSSSVG